MTLEGSDAGSVVSTLLSELGYPAELVRAAEWSPNPRGVIENLMRKVVMLERDPLFVVSRVPYEYMHDVAAIYDEMASDAGSAQRLLCACCRQFMTTYVISGDRLRKRLSSRFCSTACRVAADRRRRAGLPEDHPGGRGRPFTTRA